MIPQPPAIRLENVGLRRGDTWILRDIHWSVPQGACAAILGPNGSGKSTLTRILACHYWPTEGTSSVLGSTFGDASLLDLRQSIRLVQPAGPYDIDAELSAHDVVLTGFFGTLGLYDQPAPDMHAEAERLLAHVGLAHRPDHPYHTLSSGEKVRTLIARALAKEPRLLLLDEPTSGLDLRAREQVLATIQALFEPPPPSPGTPGEGRGEGRAQNTGPADLATPRPPSPARAPDANIAEKAPPRVGEGGGEGSAPMTHPATPPGASLAVSRTTNRPAPTPPTVVFITHHVEELPPATSHVLLLDQGRPAATGTPADVLKADTLSRVYQCPVSIRTAAGRHYVEVHPEAWRDLLHRPG